MFNLSEFIEKSEEDVIKQLKKTKERDEISFGPRPLLPLLYYRTGKAYRLPRFFLRLGSVSTVVVLGRRFATFTGMKRPVMASRPIVRLEVGCVQSDIVSALCLCKPRQGVTTGFYHSYGESAWQKPSTVFLSDCTPYV